MPQATWMRGIRWSIVAWTDATRMCEAKGKRLCAEAEWEKACKGPSGTRYPYGVGFETGACNTEEESADDRQPEASGRRGKCRSSHDRRYHGIWTRKSP